MAHKICAAIHVLLALALFGLLNFSRLPSDIDLCGLLILASIAATLGCWKRWRWLVALAGAPIMYGAAVAFAVGVTFNQTFGSNEMGFLIVIAALVWILEIASFIYAKKPPETPSPDDPDRRWTSILVTTPTDIRRYSVRKTAPHNSEPNPIEPIPFGRGGAGHYTSHPVGLVVVVGVLLMGLFALPEARWFLAGAVLLGGVWGFFLWFRHR